MAQRKQTGKPPSGLEWQGPSAEDQGYGPGILPSNPSDEIFQGRALPIIPPTNTTARRDFTQPTRSPLHYNDGPGTDEVVTSRRSSDNGQIDGSIASNAHAMTDHKDYDDQARRYGTNKQPYSHGSNVSTTLHGVEIRGT